MAVTVIQMGSMVAVLGLGSFILGVAAGGKKPAAGAPVPNGDGVSVTCIFPADCTVSGCLSVVFHIASTATAYFSVFYPYNGKSVPHWVFFKHTLFTVSFNISLLCSGLAITMLLWPIITEPGHLTINVHRELSYECPTVKSGLFGVGALLAIDSAALWLVALMLANNAREEFFP